MTLDSLMKAGIAKIYKEDAEQQRFFIEKICKEVRGMKPDVVYKASGFFVPNEDYILEFFGSEALLDSYGLYNDKNSCLWLHNLVLPVTDLAGTIKGLAGFSPTRYLEAHETKDWSINYYSYSTKKVFNKGRYLFTLPGVYSKALEQGYLVIVDGMFDTLSFCDAGYLAAGLMGSTLTDEILAQLALVDLIILAEDNDDAGALLYDKLSKKLKKVARFRQSKFKDSDDVLKSEYREKYLAELDNLIQKPTCMSQLLTF